jgi:hypothetical protein
MINIKIPRLSQLIPWLIIIALLISLGYCGNRLDNETAARKRDNELAAKTNADQAAEIEKRKAWELRYHEQAAKQQDIAQQAAKKADSISKVARVQSQEIRQLYAELGQPWPETDTASLALRAKRCCSLAVQREEEYTALAVADSIKDHAYLEQIDLAIQRGDTLSAALDRSYRNYQVLDSLRRIASKASKPRAKISAGVAGGFAPGFGWGGVSLQYSGPGGTHYGLEAGPSTGGMYYGGRVLRTISLRKKR